MSHRLLKHLNHLSMPSNGSKVLKKSNLELKDAKWTTLKRIDWCDPSGKERVWESAERVTNKNTTTGAVGIIALLKSRTAETRIILEKQFRPPLNKICIEVPAGMIDKDESPEQTAVREMKEETGYHGTATRCTPCFYNDPGFCNTTTFLVYLDIDLDDERNANVTPELEEGEFIEVFTPELASLPQVLRDLDDQGYAIDARIGILAEGLALSQGTISSPL